MKWGDSGSAYHFHYLNNSVQIHVYRRTEKMRLLERVRVREFRQGVCTETTATVIRYGLPGTCTVMRDEDGADNAINGECVRINQ